MGWEAILGERLVGLAFHVGKRHVNGRFLTCSFVQPNRAIRVAYSALLRISQGGRYLLVRNLHRPETFGPFSGVYKYDDFGKRELDSLLFKPQDLGPGSDMELDLRGFLPRKGLARFHRWYEKGEGRETAERCLHRELEEEIREAGLTRNWRVPADMSFRLVRTVREGPEFLQQYQYHQFRVFEIYEPTSANQSSTTRFLRRLMDAAKTNPDLLIASADELAQGRAKDDSLIGHHSAYLIGNKRFRGEDSPFSYRVSDTQDDTGNAH